MRFIKATRIFNGNHYLPAGTVLIIENDGAIHDLIVEPEIDPLKMEQIEGIITPGFINTHCHLELSHFKNVIPKHTGIVDFGLEVMKQRHHASVEIQLECMQQADEAMKQAGIVAVGDISNTTTSIAVKKQSTLLYHTFVELIALNPLRADIVMEQGNTLLTEYRQANLSASLASHAPYTASIDLIKRITDSCELSHQSTTIHNQESKAEDDFFRFKTGDYVRMYDTLKLPIDYFQASGTSSLQTVLKGLNARVNTLLVHNTFSSATDVLLAKQALSKLYWCLCPQANLYIEQSLPDVDLLMQQECCLTLGTDSLASNEALSLMDEINALLDHFPKMTLENCLQAATSNGAKFLGIESRFGTLEKRKNPGINVLNKKEGRWRVQKLL